MVDEKNLQWYLLWSLNIIYIANPRWTDLDVFPITTSATKQPTTIKWINILFTVLFSPANSTDRVENDTLGRLYQTLTNMISNLIHRLSFFTRSSSIINLQCARWLNARVHLVGMTSQVMEVLHKSHDGETSTDVACLYYAFLKL